MPKKPKSVKDKKLTEDIEFVLDQAVIDKIELDEEQQKKELNHEVIKNFLYEYLDSFVLIGYDNKSRKTMMVCCNSRKDLDALNHTFLTYNSVEEIVEDINGNNNPEESDD